MFIYAITNDVNDKAYVGLYSGKRLRYRWSVHKWDAANGSGIPLHRAIRKYGAEKFHITSVWSGHIERSKLALLEKYFIASFRTKSPNGYNLTDGGDGSIGFTHSESTKASLRGRTVGQETRKKIGLIHKGKTISQAQRLAVSKKMMGNKHLLGHYPSIETRLKISEAGRRRPRTTKIKEHKMIIGPDGKRHHREEFKAAISERQKNRMCDPAVREHLRKKNTGNKNCIGRVLSEESRKKMSEAMKASPKYRAYILRRYSKSSEVNDQPRRDEAHGV